MATNKALLATVYFGGWIAVAAAVIYFVSAAGHSPWLGVIAAWLLFGIGNGTLAYVFRARQLRAQGQEPPPFLVYLFYPKAISFKDRVPLARPLRILLGLVVLAGGAFLAFAGTLLLLTIDYSTVPHPAGAAVALVLLAGTGFGSLYVGFRLMVVKNDEPLFKWRTS